MKTTFVAGPYTVLAPHQTQGLGFCIAAGPRILAQIKSDPTQRHTKQQRAEKEATARLMAAAPAMLDLLRRCGVRLAKVLDQYGSHSPVVTVADRDALVRLLDNVTEAVRRVEGGGA